MRTLLPDKEVFFFSFFLKIPLDFFISEITLILNFFSENHERLFLMYSNSLFDNGETGSDVFSDLLFSVNVSMHSTAQHSTAQHSTAQHSTAQKKVQTAFALHSASLFSQAEFTVFYHLALSRNEALRLRPGIVFFKTGNSTGKQLD